MLCLKKRRTYSFTQGVCADLPRRSSKDNHRYEESLNMVITTLPRKNRTREERPSRMVLTVTEDTPADMLAGSMELLVQLPREHQVQTQRVTVQRSTPMMDLLVQIATAHKLAASSYTLQAVGERGMVLPHQPSTPIGALDALQVKLLPKQGTFVPRKTKQANQPFETTFRLQVHLPRNQLYVSRVSPKMNLGKILEEVCREKNLDKDKYELRHPANLEETLDLSLSLQDYHLQEVTLYAKQGRTLGSALSTQDIMALQRQEERRRQQAKQGVFGFVFKKSKEGSLSTDSLGGRSASPARSDETGRSTSPLQPPARPQRKRKPAPKPPAQAQPEVSNGSDENTGDSNKDKVVISHSRNSSDSSGYHEASVLSDNPDSSGRLPETLPRRTKGPETPRKLAHTSQSSKSLSNLATVPGTLTRGISSTSLSSTGLRKKRAAPPPPVTRPLSSAISTQALERIVDSEESLTSDMDHSKPPSDIGAPSKASSDIEERPKASSDIGVLTLGTKSSLTFDFTKPEPSKAKSNVEPRLRSGSINVKLSSTEPKHTAPVEDAPVDARVPRKRVGEPVPIPKPRKAAASTSTRPLAPKRKLAPPSPLSRTLSSDSSQVDSSTIVHWDTGSTTDDASSNIVDESCENFERNSNESNETEEKLDVTSCCSANEEEALLTPGVTESKETFDYPLNPVEETENVVSNETKKLDEDNVPSDTSQGSTLSRNEQAPKGSPGQEKKLCAVISTMPKCEHLDVPTEKRNSLLNVGKSKNDQEKVDELSTEAGTDVKGEKEKKRGEEGVKEPKRTKISRTTSKSNDFETNSLEKQKRHLTSHAEDITFALNLNVTSNIDLLPDRSKECDVDSAEQSGQKQETDFLSVGGGKSDGFGVSDATLSETDVLLQKVSDTLSSSLPVSPSHVSKEPVLSNTKKPTNQQSLKPQGTDIPDSSVMNISSPNVTVNSQQDTSDYVSAADEDLSIADWEYQLPAPPSAFRDTDSPVFNDYEVVNPTVSNTVDQRIALEKGLNKQKPATESKKLPEKEAKKEIVQEKSVKQQKPNSSLKKEVIDELENKIGILPQVSKESDSRRVSENSSTPQVAPVDNTLSNFTITTYSTQKSLNIFEEVNDQARRTGSDDRFIKSFATLSRSRNNYDENDRKAVKDVGVATLEGKKRVNKTEKDVNNKTLEPKMQTESLQRWQTGNEKSSIHRSKSYVSVCDKPQPEKDEAVKIDKSLAQTDDTRMKKSTSISNLNTAPRSNEKFSQWRDNILKRQEEPTKEKQLQSIQVLKSILPQLKNAQQTEESVPKESNETVLAEKTRSETVSSEHSITTNGILARDSQAAPNNKKVESEPKKLASETNKRYTYSGPPAISLGSWSERPNVNVKIKVDTDYKLARNKSGNRTIVNINGTKDETDHSNVVENSTKLPSSKISIVPSDRREPDELAKKLITHTTASGFKKPVLNRVNSELKVSDKPVVTGVELKKSLPESKQEDSSTIDTTPVNFKELSKAFGQDVCLRSKPKRSNVNRHSDLGGVQTETDFSKQNGHILEKFGTANDQSLTNGSQESSKPKRFTSIVGINPQNQGNFAFRNGINPKSGQLPVVKGFKIQTAINQQSQNGLAKDTPKESRAGGVQPPRPPTMPVITGVTLKSTRPKSMPVQVDSRDVLLESIRNFGGRENLKSAAERC